MTTLVRKAMASAALATSLIGVCAAPAQAAPATVSADGYWSYSCEAGRACISAPGSPRLWWNFDGCGFHPTYGIADLGQAHGNRFRITYQDGRWDEVAPSTTRFLDLSNPISSAYVYC
jgi:hypothetical protein